MRVPVATVAETRRLESELIDDQGFPASLLMERAALAVAMVTRRVLAAPGPVIVLAGTGHNGADGIAAARMLKAWGYEPVVHLQPGTRSPVLEQQLAWARAWNVAVDPQPVPASLAPGSVVIDALFGFGLNRAPEGTARATIEAVNAARPQAVIAVDLPSGLEATRGERPGAVVTATHTVAAGVLKSGVLTDGALSCVGRLSIADLGFPGPALERLAGDVLLPRELPPVPAAAHKGDRGFVLVVGGSSAMSGAPAMVSLAAGRIGAGLVYVAVPSGIRAAVASQMPEAVVFGLPEDEHGGLSEAAWHDIEPLMSRCDAAVVGPGLGRGDGGSAIARRLWSEFPGPMVADADALQEAVLGGSPAGARVITPHPGEMGRLLGRTVSEVQGDRLSAARHAADRFKAITVLKGARTLIQDPDGTYGVNATGHPAMATAGSGDVLAGLIGGLLAQGLEPLEAARQGVVLHGLCGEAAVQAGNGRSILALDMVGALGVVLPSLGPARPLDDVVWPLDALVHPAGWPCSARARN